MYSYIVITHCTAGCLSGDNNNVRKVVSNGRTVANVYTYELRPVTKSEKRHDVHSIQY